MHKNDEESTTEELPLNELVKKGEDWIKQIKIEDYSTKYYSAQEFSEEALHSLRTSDFYKAYEKFLPSRSELNTALGILLEAYDCSKKTFNNSALKIGLKKEYILQQNQRLKEEGNSLFAFIPKDHNSEVSPSARLQKTSETQPPLCEENSDVSPHTIINDYPEEALNPVIEYQPKVSSSSKCFFDMQLMDACCFVFGAAITAVLFILFQSLSLSIAAPAAVGLMSCVGLFGIGYGCWTSSSMEDGLSAACV